MGTKILWFLLVISLAIYGHIMMISLYRIILIEHVVIYGDISDNIYLQYSASIYSISRRGSMGKLSESDENCSNRGEQVGAPQQPSRSFHTAMENHQF